MVEPFANLRLEERLGYLGVEVVRTISLVEWVTNHIFKKRRAFPAWHHLGVWPPATCGVSSAATV